MKFTRMFDHPVSIKDSGYKIVTEEERHIDLQLAVDCIRANGENYLDNIIGGIYDMPVICKGEDGNVYAAVFWADKPLAWELMREVRNGD